MRPPGRPGPDARVGRAESPTERADRNWDELLQELRVMQTGVQIFTGFLLTLPFQQRFETLDSGQRGLYLVLVVLAVATTGLLVTPVSIHRALFRRHLKASLVTAGDHLARVALVLVGLLMTGAVVLAFDVVVGRAPAVAAGAAVLVGLASAWVALPVSLARRAPREPPAPTESDETVTHAADADDPDDGSSSA